MKRCTKCCEWKDESEFYKDKSKKDGLTCRCKDCQKLATKHYVKTHKEYHKNYRETHEEQFKNYQKKYNEPRKKFLNSLKRPCYKCGEDRLYLIQFHHINPVDKSFGIAEKVASKEQIEAEVNKCVCLCANCHQEFHYFYGRHPKHPVDALNEYLNEEEK